MYNILATCNLKYISLRLECHAQFYFNTIIINKNDTKQMASKYLCPCRGQPFGHWLTNIFQGLKVFSFYVTNVLKIILWNYDSKINWFIFKGHIVRAIQNPCIFKMFEHFVTSVFDLSITWGQTFQVTWNAYMIVKWGTSKRFEYLRVFSRQQESMQKPCVLEHFSTYQIRVLLFKGKFVHSNIILFP